MHFPSQQQATARASAMFASRHRRLRETNSAEAISAGNATTREAPVDATGRELYFGASVGEVKKGGKRDGLEANAQFGTRMRTSDTKSERAKVSAVKN